MELIARAPVARSRNVPRDVAPRVRDRQPGWTAGAAGRVSVSGSAGGEGVECQFFRQKRKYLFLGGFKYWTMTECTDIDLTAREDVLNRALLYRDRRDFVIRQGDTGKREFQPLMDGQNEETRQT